MKLLSPQFRSSFLMTLVGGLVVVVSSFRKGLMVNAAAQDEDPSSLCSSVESFNTTYNNIDSVPIFSGIMFEMNSKGNGPLEILSLEVDVRRVDGTSSRNDTTTTGTNSRGDDDDDDDLWMEVYSLKGQYELVKHDESAWTLHARTRAVWAPEGPGSAGVIIPRRDFTPILMQPYERRSFYIRMVNDTRPYRIDSTVYALSKTGEVYRENDDFIFYTGVALQRSAFASDDEFSSANIAINTTVFPQFAGVVHYHHMPQQQQQPQPPTVSSSCLANSMMTTTTATFQFITNVPVTSALMSKVNDIIDSAIADNILTLPVFDQYTTSYGLQQNKDVATKTTTISFRGNCPLTWTSCGIDKAMSSTVSLVHSNTLPSSVVLDQIYQIPQHEILQRALLEGLGFDTDSSADETDGHVNAALPAPKPDIVSIGMNSTWADFVITIHGVPTLVAVPVVMSAPINGKEQPVMMNTLQKGLFQDSMLHFLNISLAKRTSSSTTTNNNNRHVEVYSVHLTGQRAGDDDSGSTTTIQVYGSISGAQNAYSPVQNFANHLELALQQESDFYQAILQASILRPYQADDTGLYDYFVNVTNVTGHFVPGKPIVWAGSSSNDGAKDTEGISNLHVLAIVLGSIVGFLVLVAVIYFIRKCYLERAAYEKELREYRQEMKLERRRRRGEVVDGPSTSSIPAMVQKTTACEEEGTSSSSSSSSSDDDNKAEKNPSPIKAESKTAATAGTNTTRPTQNSSFVAQSSTSPDDIESGTIQQASKRRGNLHENVVIAQPSALSVLLEMQAIQQAELLSGTNCPEPMTRSSSSSQAKEVVTRPDYRYRFFTKGGGSPTFSTTTPFSGSNSSGEDDSISKNLAIRGIRSASSQNPSSSLQSPRLALS